MTELVDGNRLSLLESGREYFPALEEACNEAQSEIYLESYIYEHDAAGHVVAPGEGPHVVLLVRRPEQDQVRFRQRLHRLHELLDRPTALQEVPQELSLDLRQGLHGR